MHPCVGVALTTRLLVWGGLALAASTAACGSDGSALRVLDTGQTTYTSAGTMNVVIGYTVMIAEVLRPVTLLRAAPSSGGDKVEVLAARVNFKKSDRREDDQPTPGGLCLGKWPPKAWGPRPTYPLEGLELSVGEVPVVTLFVRARAEGDVLLEGVEITYSDGTRVLRQVSVSVALDMAWREREKDLPKQGRACVLNSTLGFLEL